MRHYVWTDAPESEPVFLRGSAGFVFSVIVEATGSVFASMAVHFFINGWSVLLIALMGPLSEYLDSALAAAMPSSFSRRR